MQHVQTNDDNQHLTTIPLDANVYHTQSSNQNKFKNPIEYRNFLHSECDRISNSISLLKILTSVCDSLIQSTDRPADKDDNEDPLSPS